MTCDRTRLADESSASLVRFVRLMRAHSESAILGEPGGGLFISTAIRPHSQEYGPRAIKTADRPAPAIPKISAPDRRGTEHPTDGPQPFIAHPSGSEPGTDICRCRTAPAAIRAGSATTDPETNDDRLAAQVCASDCLAVLVPDGKGGQLVALDAIPVRNRYSHRLSADPDRIPLHTALGEERRRQCRGQNEQQQLFHIFHTSNPPHRDARSPHFPPLPASIRATRSAIIRGVTACMQR